MSKHFIPIAVVLAISMFSLDAYAATPQHEHEHHAQVAVPAQRWTPDAPLREGMRRARAAVDRLQAVETGNMDSQSVVKQAAAVEGAVVYMFSNCKLSAEPDAALHSILVPLLSEAQALKADPAKVGAVARMRAQIARYPQYFDDPDWDRAVSG